MKKPVDGDESNEPVIVRTTLDEILKHWKPDGDRPPMREVGIEEWPDLPVDDQAEHGTADDLDLSD